MMIDHNRFQQKARMWRKRWSGTMYIRTLTSCFEPVGENSARSLETTRQQRSQFAGFRGDDVIMASLIRSDDPWGRWVLSLLEQEDNVFISRMIGRK
jgi:hypothetical protein